MPSPRTPAAWRRALGLALACAALPALIALLPALAALLLALSALLLPAQESPLFVRDRIDLRDELAALLPFDLDGDGRQELVVLEADRAHSRDVPLTLRVLRGGASGFVPLPGATVALPPHVSLAGMAAFRGGPGLALLLPGEVVIWPWRGGRFAPESAGRLAVSSIFPVASGDLKRGVDWLADLDGDGFSEVLIPRFDGLEVLAQTASGGLQRRALLRTRAEARMLDWFRRDLVAYELPALSVQQVDGRGWQDLVLYQDGQLWVFLLDATQNGGEPAPALALDLQPPKPFDPREPWDPPQRLVDARDLNNDGHFDLIFSKNSAADSQFNTRTTVLVYFGRAGTGGAPIAFEATPDQVFANEGFSLPLVLDVDADGRGDMVLVNVEIGFWTVVKALIARSVSADAAFYLMPAAGRFPREPTRLQTYSVTFSLSRSEHQPIAQFGDLNGDGLPDLLLSADKETIGIHWGRRGAVWPNSPDARFKDFLPIQTKRVQVSDLDGDGQDDLLFLYNRDDIRAMPDVNRSVTVLRRRAPQAPRPAAPVQQAAQR